MAALYTEVLTLIAVAIVYEETYGDINCTLLVRIGDKCHTGLWPATRHKGEKKCSKMSL